MWQAGTKKNEEDAWKECSNGAATMGTFEGSRSEPKHLMTRGGGIITCGFLALSAGKIMIRVSRTPLFVHICGT